MLREQQDYVEEFSRYKDLLPSDIHMRPYKQFIGKFSASAAELAWKVVDDQDMERKKKEMRKS